MTGHEREPDAAERVLFVPDAAQRAVIALAPEASGVVVGAPGSGKTAALVARVEALVAGGLDPDALVVLTPSRRTATALRDELGLAVGVPTAGPLARSVTSFAWRLVRAAAVAGGEEPPQLLTGGDEDRIVADLLAGDEEDERSAPSRWPEWLGPSIRRAPGFRAEVRAFLAACTAGGVDPDLLEGYAAAQQLPVWASLASFARTYHAVRGRMRGAYRDAPGLVQEAVLLAGRPEAALLAEIRVILVDDAQELTRGGVDLLLACRDRGIAVVAFGDPDVGSGAFRGATPENFALLAAELGIAAVLDTPHRSVTAITDLAREVTSRIGAAGVVAHRRPPGAAGGAGEVEETPAVRAMIARSSGEEFDLVARVLRERHLRAGVAWRDCAVIVHDTRQVAAFEAELAAREVPARAATAATSLGAHRAVRGLLHVVRMALRGPAEWTEDDAEEALLGVVGGLDPVGLRRLRTALRHDELAAGGVRGGRELAREALTRPLELKLLDIREARRAERLASALAALGGQRGEGASAHELLWTAWEASGREREWVTAAAGHGPIAAGAARDLDAVVALFQAAKRWGERDVAADASEFVEGMLTSAVTEDRLEARSDADVVRILTPAGALGIEADTVVVAGVQEGVWPNTRLRGGLLETWRLEAGADAAPELLDRRRQVLHDELRLFVRAVSRARRHLVVSAVADDDTGPSALFEFLPRPDAPEAAAAGGHPLTLRGLVAEHRRTLTTAGASTPVRGHAAGQLALLAAEGVPAADPAEWYGVAAPTSTAPLRDLAADGARVSPSRLGALETCQLDWVIGDLGGDAGGVTAGLGTILHAALEHAVDADETAIQAEVDARWGELVFPSAWQDRAEHERARVLVHRLALYLAEFERSGGSLLGAEPRFEVALDGMGGDVVLSGFIDRVELGADGRVVITDLKTGKSEPQTDAKVATHPQLAAYQLAFEAGAIPAATGLPSGGAKLLVLRPTSQKPWVEPHQPPFDEESRAAFLDRIRDAVGVMTGESFLAPYEDHCRDEHSHGLCRIHTVGPVSTA